MSSSKVSSCMTWVPILCLKLQGLFEKHKVLDNPFHDLQAVDDPLPDLPMVDNLHPDLQAIYDPIPDLSAVHVTPFDLQEVGPDLPIVGDPTFPHLLGGDDPLLDPLSLSNLVRPVDDPLSELNKNNYPLPRASTNDNPLPNLPYHIITDILSRVPAKCVFQCQCASRLLYLLTTTPFFIHTHLNRATSVIALHSFTQSSDRDIKLYFVEDEVEKIEATSLKVDFCYMLKNYPIMLWDSCDGFLLFFNSPATPCEQPFFLIWNPITKEQVTVTSPSGRLQVCGFYFHHLKGEYEVLSIYSTSDPLFEFQVFSLGTKLWRKIGEWSYPPSCTRPPIIINRTLYWMVDSYYHRPTGELVHSSCSKAIMSFNIETQEFGTMQHGGPSCSFSGLWKHDYMQLLEIEGKLGLCNSQSSTEIILWVLNQTTKSWVKRHTVTLPIYSTPEYFSVSPNPFRVEAIQVKNGEFLFRQKDRLLIYNLHSGKYKIVEKKGFENDNVRAIIHTHSLVSLNTDGVISLQRCK